MDYVQLYFYAAIRGVLSFIADTAQVVMEWADEKDAAFEPDVRAAINAIYDRRIANESLSREETEDLMDEEQDMLEKFHASTR